MALLPGTAAQRLDHPGAGAHLAHAANRAVAAADPWHAGSRAAGFSGSAVRTPARAERPRPPARPPPRSLARRPSLFSLGPLAIHVSEGPCTPAGKHKHGASVRVSKFA